MNRASVCLPLLLASACSTITTLRGGSATQAPSAQASSAQASSAQASSAPQDPATRNAMARRAEEPPPPPDDHAAIAMYRAFMNDARPYDAVVYPFMSAMDSKTMKLRSELIFGPPHPFEDAMKQLADLEQLCQSKYPNLVDPAGPRGLHDRPTAWCFVAKNRGELAKSSPDFAREAQVKDLHEWVEIARRTLKDDNGFVTSQPIDEPCIAGAAACKRNLVHFLEPRYKQVQATFDPSSIDDVMKEVDVFVHEANAAGGKRSMPSGDASSGAAAAVSAAVHKFNTKNVSVSRVVLVGEWNVVPLNSRARSGFALLKVPGDSSCRLAKIEYSEAYMGAGKFGAGQAQFYGFRVQRCQ
jgi:hypothetical protein